MKWFKHLSGSLKDSIIFEAIEKFGGDGYLVFFGTLEMMADEFDIYQPDRITLSLKKMTNLFQLSRQKTVRILRFFDEKAKKYSRENKSFFAEVNETHVTIICNRFASLADNHTANELAKTKKLLGSDLEVTSPHRKKKEEEEIYKEETLVETPVSDPCPHQEILSLYKKNLPTLTQPVEWDADRQKLLRSRWRSNPEFQDLGWWDEFFKYIATKCPFLIGDNNRQWQADLPWILQKKHFTEIREGKYERGV
ncbi:MAG: hypothetical protein A4E63_01745 [Syntrophorhabdus sp. PtaU1.Bin050]|nr:MAG: hypothetical protein A4E63_01745 [Syntrophorhabdus sp. PtaU1.Bin050]